MTARRRRPTIPLACLSILLCRLAGGANATPPPALALPLIASCLPVAMAVDRSKFRTCEQTSFCRRHRHGRPSAPDRPRAAPRMMAGRTRGGAGVYSPSSDASWASGEGRGRRPDVPGGHLPGTRAGPHRPDPERRPADLVCPHGEGLREVRRGRRRPRRGAEPRRPPPRRRGGEGPHHGGPRRGGSPVRTEVDLGRARPQRRRDVVRRRRRRDVLGDGRGDAGKPGRRGDRGEGAAGLISSLARRAGLAGHPTDGFLVLSHGDWRLMVRLSPFTVYYFRDGDGDDGPPMVVAGTGGLTHFEVRRDRGCPAAAAGERRQLGEFDVEVDGDSSGDEEPEEYTGEEEEEIVEEEEAEVDRHGGKEIVGYWEDGLAIYADGTREERRDLASDDDTGAGEERRRLEEDEFDTAGMWDERFGDHHDTKPRGPMSVGMELTFPGSTHLFGLPEHASSTQLRATGGRDGRDHHYKEPYR
ncbi:hypothetical protein THAOC_00231 [Thalassiosira oceanica]|uniref:Glycoside hydrolase family 31 N-terminal domain-containing protein n=1 Tax=Thalassiosira oceanica TaxID=159749 RepID=K0TJQ0_THAOC|nr:hypothetical protein THAOC_00231 [Thalassiosira oceanica]|eukprot:EJK77905.1 hypothetical protein THAOC_00231 [Thalassiosira oceanica]